LTNSQQYFFNANTDTNHNTNPTKGMSINDDTVASNTNTAILANLYCDSVDM